MNSLRDLGFRAAALLCYENLPEDFIQNNGISQESSVVIGFFPISNDKKACLIAPFAIKNHYKEIIKRMRTALKMSRSPFSELNKKQVRFFSNSHFPEKELAIRGKLGFRGRNTLLIHTSFGSTGLLGGMILPYELREEAYGFISNPKTNCGTCRLCEEACPGEALKDYKLDRNKCLQHWTTADGAVPDRLKDVWGARIYGCMICQDCCPWNRKEPKGNSIELGRISPEPPLAYYLTEESREIKEGFRGTALGMSWIKAEHLIRNAILSVPFSAEDDLLKEVYKFADSYDEGIRDAARWVLNKSGQTGN